MLHIPRFKTGFIAARAAGALLLSLGLMACEEGAEPLAPTSGPDLAAGATTKPGLIAYVNDEYGGIFLIGEDGSGERPLTGGTSEQDQDPDFAPGNRTLLFTRQFDPSHSEIFAIGTNGRKLRQLTSLGGINRQGRFSPDGRQIVFIHDDKLYLMSANGADPEWILSSTTMHLTAPTWSPDGTRLAFDVFNPDNGTYHLGVLTLATGSWYTIQCPAACASPRWHPQGDKLVIESLQGPGFSILLFKDPNNGSTSAFETSPIGMNAVGGWAPDGERFVFSSNRYDVSGDLFIRNGDGQIVPLTSGPAMNRQPTWSK